MDERAEHFAAGVNLAGDRATAEVVDVLRRAGVEAIVLKGPVTARWLRPDGGTRYSLDVDLLIAPVAGVRAGSALRGAGYEPLFVERGGEEKHASTWARDGTFAVDLHHTLVGVDASDEVVWSTLATATEEADVAGVPCTVLAPAARALSIALHAAQHGPSHERFLEDLALALDRLGIDEWREAARLATALDASRAFGTGLRSSTEGYRLAEALGLPAATTTQAALRSAGAPPTSLGFERLARAQGFRERARLVIHKLAPSPSFMRVWHPLAGRGKAGLVAAYAIRPFWLLRWSLPGARAWLRARRRARASQD
ncbi:hypothetical protein BH18ACT13_BH18ACT13_01610 [soil metagenome]